MKGIEVSGVFHAENYDREGLIASQLMVVRCDVDDTFCFNIQQALVTPE